VALAAVLATVLWVVARHATRRQFLRAYPRAPEFFALKRRLDPTNKFRNELWNKYGPSD